MKKVYIVRSFSTVKDFKELPTGGAQIKELDAYIQGQSYEVNNDLAEAFIDNGGAVPYETVNWEVTPKINYPKAIVMN